MKLLQLNMWMGRLTRQIVPLIEREKPDIITAQEVFSTNGMIAFPDRTFDLLEQVQTAGGYEYVYFSPTCDMQMMGYTVEFGNAVISKYPIINTETVFTSGEIMHSVTAENFVENTRNAQFVTIRFENTDIMLVNHHGYWEANPLGSAQSVLSMQRLTDTLRLLDPLPTIVAGDMNLLSKAPAMRLFDDLAEDLTATHAVSSTLSQLGKVQDVACDHILVNSLIQVVDFRVLSDLVSDHKALTLEFDVK